MPIFRTAVTGDWSQKLICGHEHRSREAAESCRQRLVRRNPQTGLCTIWCYGHIEVSKDDGDTWQHAREPASVEISPVDGLPMPEEWYLTRGTYPDGTER